MRVIASVQQMQRLALKWRGEGVKIGLVPTMGYLHEGHISLVKKARSLAGPNGKIVVSIYVNPTQFAPHEDLSKYPRDLAMDTRLCRAAGADVVFTPSDEEMYFRSNGDYSTYVCEERLGASMEGVSRPTHFRGVATVVTKLFNIALPSVAVFGAKDWQQAAVLKRVVRDLNIPVRMVVAPTVRERDGLAMSSRNKYLSGDERKQALVLHESIKEAQLQAGQSRKGVPAANLKALLAAFIHRQPAAKLDYVQFFNPETLETVATVKKGSHMALAVFIGKTRLIDNGAL